MIRLERGEGATCARRALDSKRGSAAVPIACIFLVLAFGISRASADAANSPDTGRNSFAGNAMHVHFIDVGDGAATLVEFPCGVVMIDAGGESNQTTEALTA